MATAIPPLSGGADIHGSEAAHAVTIADSLAESPEEISTAISGSPI